jgi:rfaE bifunctional protein nucleotidyltransferase chain/domain
MLVQFSDIHQLVESLRKNGKRIVFTNGCFDIIHAGHVYYLNEAKKLGDVLILGLNSDESVRNLKGPERPVNSEEDRAAVLLGLRSVDHVVIFGEETPFNLITEILPDVLIKGGDYTIDTIVGADIVQNNGGEVVVIPFLSGRSTSGIIKKISK